MHNSQPEIRSQAEIVRAFGAGRVAAGEDEAIFIGSDVFGWSAFGTNHPLNIIRHAAVMDLVKILGWLPAARFRPIEPASFEQITKYHDSDYVAALRHAEKMGRVSLDARQRYNIGTFENPLFPGLYERAAATVGGSIQAAQLACEGKVVFHPSGGTHHGRPDRASGFCYFNDPVFAILTLLDEGRERVLYVDLDAHHGDGVELAFADEPRVLTVSIHEENRWPYSGSNTDERTPGVLNLPVPKRFNDNELEFLVQEAILPTADAFATDALVVCCGADCLAGDPLSGMMLSNVALWETVGKLVALKRPTVIVGGGGYNPWTVTRYWAGLWGRVSGQEIPEQLPTEATELLRGMDCDLVDEEDVDDCWMTTLADFPSRGPVREAVRSLLKQGAEYGLV